MTSRALLVPTRQQVATWKEAVETWFLLQFWPKFLKRETRKEDEIENFASTSGLKPTAGIFLQENLLQRPISSQGHPHRPGKKSFLSGTIYRRTSCFT
jgi:hypothetical protein